MTSSTPLSDHKISSFVFIQAGQGRGGSSVSAMVALSVFLRKNKGLTTLFLLRTLTIGGDILMIACAILLRIYVM